LAYIKNESENSWANFLKTLMHQPTHRGCFCRSSRYTRLQFVASSIVKVKHLQLCT